MIGEDLLHTKLRLLCTFLVVNVIRIIVVYSSLCTIINNYYYCYWQLLIINAGTFESRIMEYREEMTEFSSSLRQNVKNVGKKIREFLVESGLFHWISCHQSLMNPGPGFLRVTWWAFSANLWRGSVWGRAPLKLNTSLHCHNLGSRPICHNICLFLQNKTISSDIWGHHSLDPPRLVVLVVCSVVFK